MSEGDHPGGYHALDAHVDDTRVRRRAELRAKAAIAEVKPTRRERPHDPRGRGKSREFVGPVVYTAVGSASSRPPPPAATVAERVAALVDELHRCGPGEDTVVHDRLLAFPPSIVLSTMMDFFPGALWFHRDIPHQRPARGRNVCAVARLMVALGPAALPYANCLLRARHPDVRYYGALIAADLQDHELLLKMYARIFDRDPGVRELVLRLFFDLPTAVQREWLTGLRSTAESGAIDARLLAVEALAVLRDPLSVESLIVALSDEVAGPSARRALICLTATDRGEAPESWQGWWETHRGTPRTDWLVVGLSHERPEIRAIAEGELARLSE